MAEVDGTERNPKDPPGSAVDGHGHGRTQQTNGDRRHDNPSAHDRDADHPSARDRPSFHNRDARHATGEIRDKITDKKQKIKDKTNPPGGFDPTPLPDAPPGYTVRFLFHRATNLPVADLHTHSADPFLHATLTADVPRRHREDPPLTFRTRTVRRSTAPVWDQEWVVANVPPSGFTLKCRLYDEDDPDGNDRLGNVTIRVARVDEAWPGLGRDESGDDGGGDGTCAFEVQKRAGSKRAYLLKAAVSALRRDVSMTPRLYVGARVLGRSPPPHAQMYTVGPTTWVRHYSPMIGRLVRVRVNRDEEHDVDGRPDGGAPGRTQKYDFQANEIQLAGPVPPNLYHRYVEFRPLIGRMFSSHGLRGRLLHAALHKQHNRIYSYNAQTEFGAFAPESREAALQFLRMAHFDEGHRLFTYVLTLDGLLRFTETGHEFGIDLLSKHTMHSDVATYIACSGEFFIRRVARERREGHESHDGHEAHGRPSRSSSSRRDSWCHKSHHQQQQQKQEQQEQKQQKQQQQQQQPQQEPRISSSSARRQPPLDPSRYQLIIDNDSGTYRPDKSVLPDLQRFLQRNFPGLAIRAMHCADDELVRLKKEQAELKKRAAGGQRVAMVLNRSPGSSSSSSRGSFSSSDESRLAHLERHGRDERPLRSKKERAYEVLEDPTRLKDWRGMLSSGGGGEKQGGGGGEKQGGGEGGESTRKGA